MPEAHLLDLTMTIAPDLVLIAQDGMAHVFDYDPLIRQIGALAREHHYETQERLMTCIVYACAAYPAIKALDTCAYRSARSPAQGCRSGVIYTPRADRRTPEPACAKRGSYRPSDFAA